LKGCNTDQIKKKNKETVFSLKPEKRRKCKRIGQWKLTIFGYEGSVTAAEVMKGGVKV